MFNQDEFSRLGVDPVLSKQTTTRVSGLSPSTIYREQQAGRFPQWEELSAGRKGLRRSRLIAWLEGKRAGWSDAA
jgi:predicted DNA-binding transcriptional regulator AlpA